MRFPIAAVFASTIVLASPPVHGAVIYNTWTSNVAPNGNYELTITHDAAAHTFSYMLTVNPWNAEALGVFVDFGNRDISGPVALTNISPAGEVALHALETTLNTCGDGCNLNGLNLPLGGDGEWELVFRLGDSGFEGIQTFSWATQDFGLDESALGLVGIRAQNLCTSGTLPTGSCGDSDKSYGFGERTTKVQDFHVPEPASLALAAIGLVSVGVARRKRASPGC